MITDEHKAYVGLNKKGYSHITVNHSMKQYVNNVFHTNGIESFWSLLKRGYYGIHHSMSKKHLIRYVTEFAERQNQRKNDVIDQMCSFADNMSNIQLPYKVLIA